MLLWIKLNLANIIVIAVIALVVFFIIRSMVMDKRAGRSSCGGNCGSCAGCGACHPQTEESKK